MRIFTKSLGVDMGTAFLRICRGGDVEVFSVPSLAGLDSATGKVSAIGYDAGKLLSDTSSELVPVRPVASGALSDYEISCEILKKSITRFCGRNGFKSVVTAPVSFGTTDVELRALRSALMYAGAKKVQFIEVSIAAAIGVGIDVDFPVGRMIIDIGAGSTEIAVICMGEVLCGKTLKIGGSDFDCDIKNFIKKHYGINIGEKAAEDIKIKIGTVSEEQNPVKITVCGREISSGLPGCAVVSSSEISCALSSASKKIIDGIRSVIEEIPVDLIPDITKSGIVLTGGGAKLDGLCALIKDETGIDATVAKNPETAVVRGLAIAFSDK